MLASDPIALCQLIRSRSAHPSSTFYNVPAIYAQVTICLSGAPSGGSICAASSTLPRRPQPAPVRSCCCTSLILVLPSTLACTIHVVCPHHTLITFGAALSKSSTDVPYFRDSILSDPNRTLISP